jgi:hypothetical protein
MTRGFRSSTIDVSKKSPDHASEVNNGETSPEKLNMDDPGASSGGVANLDLRRPHRNFAGEETASLLTKPTRPETSLTSSVFFEKAPPDSETAPHAAMLQDPT